jgi:predicted NodU family carbamoyl transferase
LGKSQLPQFLFGERLESHAAFAFFPSPYKKAGVLCMAGVGEWAIPCSENVFPNLGDLVMDERQILAR